jgi:hypothetical protein
MVGNNEGGNQTPHPHSESLFTNEGMAHSSVDGLIEQGSGR